MNWFSSLFSKKSKPNVKPVASSEAENSTESAAVSEEQSKSLQQRLEQAKTMHRQGQVEQALNEYKAIIEQDPKHAGAIHMLAIVKLQQGDLASAQSLFEQAIEIDGSQADFHSNLGNALAGQGQLELAYESFARAMQLDDSDLNAKMNAISALTELGRSKAAQTLCEQVLNIDNNNVECMLALANICNLQKDYQAALQWLVKAEQVDENNSDILIQLCNQYELLNDIANARMWIDKALTVSPSSARAIFFNAIICRREGRLQDAEELLKQALNSGLNPKEQTEALNQLGLVSDKLGLYQQAYAAFNQCNQMIIAQTHNAMTIANKYLQGVEAIHQFFNEAMFAQLTSLSTAETSGPSEVIDFQPVFFVGFPRSGTTLVEQMLKAHSDIVTTDEESPITAVVNEIDKSLSGYPANMASLDETELNRLRQIFADNVVQKFGPITGKTLVDKKPLNIIHLGLAKVLFPKAKIIFAHRDPRDTCLSCFMQKFETNSGMVNFLELEQTVKAYQLIMALWLHFKELLANAETADFGNDIFEYQYEDLVDDVKGTLTKVLTHIDLPWQDNLNDYRKEALNRSISTPSYREVTKEVNKSAVNRWQNYQPVLQGALPLLEPFVKKFNY